MSYSIHDFTIPALNGGEIKLADYKGKKILLVNTASACGLTPQYKQLQELHEGYYEKVQVIGFPCNDFGAQEPGSATEIATFCSTNFGVTFPLSEKIKVLGADAHPLYQFLTRKELNGVQDSEVQWNFQKYLINEEGQLQQVFSPMLSPIDEEILKAIGI